MILPIVAGMALLLIAVLLIIVLVLQNWVAPKEGDPGTSLVVSKVTVTPGAPTPSVSPPSQSRCETIISSGDVQIAVSLPISLTLGEEAFPVEVILPEEEGWGYPAGSSGSAAWMCGTVVNYVVLLEPTAENEALLAGLAPGEEIVLQLSNGVMLFFGFDQQREMKADEVDVVFAQLEPHLTLLLERQGGAWLVVSADYLTRVEPVYPPASDTLAGLDVPVRVGDAQVTVWDGYALRSVPGLPAGTMYYLVEFSVENVGASPLDADVFTMQLQDGMGNKYLISPAASALGDSGLLEGEIAPGEAAEGSAGYLVPDTLSGPTLVWTFSPSPGSEVWASVGIAYEGEEPSAEPARAEVTITDAFLSGDESRLIIEGEIRNVGGSPLTVEVRDITLTSSAGMGELIIAAPPLPWTIEPGQSRVIELQFEKPDAASVLLTLLGHSFEISGLE
ncbi:MAG: DUF4352 domain-containing protein [Anaerolineae bacterium]|nr:DUF4352 domain-containing protein [Anaerolineae bacterium]